MNCPRCEADPQPKGFGNPRHCAFVRDRLAENAQLVVESDFTFHEDNWNCATITALLLAYDPNGDKTVYGPDESLDLIPCVHPSYESELRGWLVITRYKRRGRVSSLVHVGDFFPVKSVTLATVERTINYWLAQREREALDARR